MMLRPLAVALCTLSLPAMAQPMAPPLPVCASLGELATTVMDNRQSGVPVTVMLELAPEGTEGAGVFRALIAEAYTAPVLVSWPEQKEAINGFRREVVASCMATVNGLT